MSTDLRKKSSQAKALAVPSGRIARFGRLGSLTAGVAGNVALNGIAQLGRGQKPSLRDLLLTANNISRVADQLAKMRGAAMKMGQLMSMDTGDVLPPELSQIMARLRDDAHFMPPAQLKKVLNQQWPANWIRAFAKFDVRPIAAASIGQVHRTELKKGPELAIKVQYPGVADSIDSDVANLGFLMRMSGLVPKGLDLDPYLAQAREQLREETDYRREGAQMAHFYALLEDMPRFLVPKLEPEWSTKHVLAMRFIEGVALEHICDQPQFLRDDIVSDLIRLTLAELLTFGEMQTDPNFANYLYVPSSNQIALLDFGAARRLDPKIVTLYRKLMQAGWANRTQEVADVIEHLGFVGPRSSDKHRATIVAMIQRVFQALKDQRPFDFTDTRLSQELQRDAIALAQDGFVPPLVPFDVLLVQRKLGGVFLLAARLGARIDLVSILAPFLEPQNDGRAAAGQRTEG